MNLRLVDTYELLYSGSKDKWIMRGMVKNAEGKYVENVLPCGGITYLLNFINEWQTDDDVLVFCVDSPPTYKRMLFENHFEGRYKGNRPPAPKEIKLQKQMVLDVLDAIGANYVVAESYEADDIIASMVHYYHDNFEKIFIHAKDSDLFYLVDEKVEIMPLSKETVKISKTEKKFRNGKHISLDNWSQSVKKGIICPRNVLTLFKILDGEPGDNIPPVPRELGFTIVNNLPKSDYPKCGDNKFLRDYILDVTNNNETVKAIVDLIQPVILPYSTVELSINDFNNTVYMDFAALCECKWKFNWQYTNNDKCEEIVNKYLRIYQDE